MFWSAMPRRAICLVTLAACNDMAEPRAPVDSSVARVTITPPAAIMNVGEMLKLVADVAAGPGQTNRSVRWTTGNAAVATVDAMGVVKTLIQGTTILTATSLADTTVNARAQITVVATFLVAPTIISINHDGKAADLGNVFGQLDVVVRIDTAEIKTSAVELVLRAGAMDTVVATRGVNGGAPDGMDKRSLVLTLSFNTAGFKNGPYTLRMRATTATGTIVGSSSVAITLNNQNTGTAPISALLSYP
jgi:alpha-L-fucosidase 2